MDFVDNVNSITTSYLEDDDVANVILVDQISNSIGESAGSDKLDNFNSSVLLIFAPEGSLANFSIAPDILNASEKSAGGYRDSLSIIIPISLCYFIIFVTGILGNVITCVVIAKNKTMHTATNYYLFNLAVSDFFVLIIGKYQVASKQIIYVELKSSKALRILIQDMKQKFISKQLVDLSDEIFCFYYYYLYAWFNGGSTKAFQDNKKLMTSWAS